MARISGCPTSQTSWQRRTTGSWNRARLNLICTWSGPLLLKEQKLNDEDHGGRWESKYDLRIIIPFNLVPFLLPMVKATHPSNYVWDIYLWKRDVSWHLPSYLEEFISYFLLFLPPNSFAANENDIFLSSCLRNNFISYSCSPFYLLSIQYRNYILLSYNAEILK